MDRSRATGSAVDAATGRLPSSLAHLAATRFASSEELAEAVLRLVRDVLGLDTALITRVDGDTWVATHAQGDRLGVRPGAELPLRDTF